MEFFFNFLMCLSAFLAFIVLGVYLIVRHLVRLDMRSRLPENQKYVARNARRRIRKKA